MNELIAALIVLCYSFATGIFYVLSCLEKPVWSLLRDPDSEKAAADRFPARPQGATQRRQYGVAALDKGAPFSAGCAFGDHTVTLLGGYSRFDNFRQNNDSPDFSEIGFLDSTTTGGKFEQYSLEARVASPTGGQLEYILGAFYLDSDEQLSQDLGAVLPPNPALPPSGVMRKIFDLDQEVQTWSIFGSATLNMTERLSATAQVRYSEEDKDFVSQIYQLISPFGLDPGLRAVFTTVDSPCDNLPRLNDFDLGRSEEVVDYAFNLQWEMTDNAMVYVSYGKVSKTGGYTFFPITLTPFPLTIDGAQYEDKEGRNVEGGIKATLLDNRAQVNLAVFHTEYDDMQQITFAPQRGGFDIANADVTSVGVEQESR